MNTKQGGTEAETRVGERRGNLVLRALIDEMLEKIREVNRNATSWTEEELGRAQAELEAIMARVRKVAVQSDR